LLTLFFREIRCRGADRVDIGSGGLVIAWHPNGLIDPALIFSFFPGRIVFGARHGLFEWPLLGRLFRAIGTVPIYRASDDSNQSRSERYHANQESLDALATEIASGSFSALFPEGLSHDQPHLSQIKTGAARLYLRALSISDSGNATPVIIPVGLFYDAKNIFRSRALVLFHDPIEIPEELLSVAVTSGDKSRERERIDELTRLIKDSLAEASRVTENWELHELMHRTRKLVRAERAFRADEQLKRPDIEEFEAGFSRVWYAYQVRNKDAKHKTDLLIEKISNYDKRLRSAGLEDHELSEKSQLMSVTWITLVIAQLFMLYIFLPPILIVGYVINIVPYFVIHLVDQRYSKAEKDGASIKLMVGSVIFPVFWMGTGLLAVFTRYQLSSVFPNIPVSPGFTFWITILFAVVGGFLALRYTELSKDLIRSVKIRLTKTRRRAIVQDLRKSRSDIFDELMEMSTDLNLPGFVIESGRVSTSEPDVS